MEINDVLKKRMDEYVFIELKSPLTVGEGEIPADLPLPVRTNTMTGWVKTAEDAEIQLENLPMDLVMVMGIDETFPHFHEYYQILKLLTQGQVRAAIEQFVVECYERQAPDDAVVMMRALRFLFPKEVDVQFSYAIALEMFAQKRLKEGAQRACDFLYRIAAEEYQAILEENPGYFPARYKMGHYYLYNNQYQAAQTQFIEFVNGVGEEEKYLEMKQEVMQNIKQIEPYCVYEEAAAYVQAGQFEEAIVLLENLVEGDHEWWQAELLIGIALRNANRVSDALGHLRRASFMQESEVMVHFELAQTYYAMGNLDESMTAIQKAISLDRNWSDCYLVRAQIYRALGQMKEALQDLQVCQQLAPEDPTAGQLIRQWEQDS